MKKKIFQHWFLFLTIIFVLILPLASFGSTEGDLYFRIYDNTIHYFKQLNPSTPTNPASSRAVRVESEYWFNSDYSIKSENCGVDYFAPNKTVAEWGLFINNKPSCLTITIPFCGDNICQIGWENPANCSQDCPFQGCGQVVHGGKSYKTVLIGNQCWLTENLNMFSTITFDFIKKH